MRRVVVGAAVGVVLAVAFGLALVPFRGHVGPATPAVVLVVPVVVAVVLGGLWGGVVGVVAGAVVYDLLFLPPYGTLSVADGDGWAALAAYAVVMVLVARVVHDLAAARAEARRRAEEAGRLVELSELLVAEVSVHDLLQVLVRTVATVFDIPAVAVLVPGQDGLEVAAAAGDDLTPAELDRLGPRSGTPLAVGPGAGGHDGLRTLALGAPDRPAGMLVMRGSPASVEDRSLLRTFANHAALALERARLREQAVRSELLDEVDRLRHALLGAVSHDLRSPLATLKLASSLLSDPAITLAPEDQRELHELVDVETDRLIRLVTSLLDMTRVEAGPGGVRREPWSLAELVDEAVDDLRPTLGEREVEVVAPGTLPMVDVDEVLIRQVLVNLLDNAHRHAPPGSPITVAGVARGDTVAVSVTDRGPGVPAGDREAVFDRFVRYDTGGRAGLGLNIAKTFVEAHDQRLWIEDAPGGGARFVFTLPTPDGPSPDGPSPVTEPDGHLSGGRR